MKKRVGLSIYKLQEKYGDKKAIEIAASVGADAIDFNFLDSVCDFRDPKSLHSKSDDEIISYYSDLKKHADSLGIEIHQTHGTGRGYVNDKEKDRALIANNRIDCMATKALGAKTCVIHNPSTMMLPKAEPQLMRDLSFDMLSNMIKNAQKYDIKIASETFGDAVFFNCVDFFGIIEEFEMSCDKIFAVPELRDNFTVCVDTGHSNKAMRFGNPTPADVIRRVGKNTSVLHLNDNDTFTDQHKIPMTGCIDWKDVFDALDEVGYDGVYNMELFLSHFGDEFMIETAEFAVKVMRNILTERYGK